MPRIFTLNLDQASGQWVSTNPGAFPTQNDNALTPEAVNPNAEDATGIVARQNPDTTQPAADADGDAYRVVAFNPRVFPQVGQHMGRRLFVQADYSYSVWCLMQAVQGWSEADKKMVFRHIVINCYGFKEMSIAFAVPDAHFSLPPPSLNAPLHPHPRSFTYEVSLLVFFQDIVDNADLVSLAGRVTPRHCELLVGTGFTAATVRLMPSVQMIGEGKDSRILFGHRHCIVLSPAYWMRNKECWFSGHPQAAAKKYTIVLDLSSRDLVHNLSKIGAAYALADGVRHVVIILKGDVFIPASGTVTDLKKVVEAVLQVSDNIGTYTVVNNHVGKYTFVGVERLGYAFGTLANELLDLIPKNRTDDYLMESVPGTAKGEDNSKWSDVFIIHGATAWFKTRFEHHLLVTGYTHLSLDDYVAPLSSHQRQLLTLE